MLGAAGVSLAMTGAAAANAPTVEVPSQDAGPRILLAEEEIFDVSLATFHVFDRESELGPRVRLAAGRCGGGCGGCRAGGCGGCHAAAMGCMHGGPLVVPRATPAVVGAAVMAAGVAEGAEGVAAVWAFG